jgi:1,4-dihydroxy-2-naphthoyl-CoA hydrolase
MTGSKPAERESGSSPLRIHGIILEIRRASPRSNPLFLIDSLIIAMPFAYHRTIHFPDTDAAGVVFFARYLSICHEAYEESLSAFGVPLGSFFVDNGAVIPVFKSEASYLRPLACGDRLRIEVAPRSLSETSYAIDYVIWKKGAVDKRAAVARTEHVCISSESRERLALPDNLLAWVQAG